MVITSSFLRLCELLETHLPYPDSDQAQYRDLDPDQDQDPDQAPDQDLDLDLGPDPAQYSELDPGQDFDPDLEPRKLFCVFPLSILLPQVNSLCSVRQAQSKLHTEQSGNLRSQYCSYTCPAARR